VTPSHALAGLEAMNADKPLTKYEPKALAAQVIERYMDGEKVADIAKDLGLKGGEQIYRLLCKYAEDDWKDAQASRALVEFERAKEGLQTASDGLSLARAREQAKVAQWELERVLRRLYGQEAPQVAGSGTININIGITRSPSQVSHVIDSVEVVPVDQTGKGEGGEG
jgi:hypothetical protein